MEEGLVSLVLQSYLVLRSAYSIAERSRNEPSVVLGDRQITPVLFYLATSDSFHKLRHTESMLTEMVGLNKGA